MPAHQDVEDQGQADRDRCEMGGAPATAVLSTTVTRKKASTASTMNPIAGVIVTGAPPRTRPCASSACRDRWPATQHDPQQQRCGDSAGDLADDVAGRLGGGDGADSEDADGHGRFICPPIHCHRRR